MSNILLELIISVEHKGCWSCKVDKYVVKVLNIPIDTEEGFMRSLILLDKKYKDLIIYTIRKSQSFLGYSKLMIAGDGKKIIDLRRKYGDTVVEVIN